jgi:hypothetical protein
MQRGCWSVSSRSHTFISQLETGRGRIPPDRYLIWAEALKIPPKEFVQHVLRFYDPVTYGIERRPARADFPAQLGLVAA